MKKQDNENLIQELTNRLDWYMMEASDEEFDAEQVQALMKLLDSLKSEEENEMEEELPVEEAVSDFWKYCEEREEEEKRLYGTEENEKGDETLHQEEKAEHKESIFRRALWYFHRHRMVAVAAAVLVIIVLGGSWQAVANAEKHGGFFWWMDKSEEGTTMITAPEGVEDDFANDTVDRYYNIADVPDEFRIYIEQICEIQSIPEYEFDYSRIITSKLKDKVYVVMKGDKDIIQFEVIIYPRKMLRARETYLDYFFENEFEDGEVSFDILSKKETTGDSAYLICFYFGKNQYIITGSRDQSILKDIAIEYKNIILKYGN